MTADSEIQILKGRCGAISYQAQEKQSQEVFPAKCTQLSFGCKADRGKWSITGSA